MKTKKANIDKKRENTTQVRNWDMVGRLQGRGNHAKCKTTLCIEIKTVSYAMTKLQNITITPCILPLKL